MIEDHDTHILDVPKYFRRRLGQQAVVELPQCMGRDVKLSMRRDRLYAFSGSSNVVVILPSGRVEMPADCA